MKKAILLISFLISCLSVQAQRFDAKLFDGRIKQLGQQVDERKQGYKKIKKENADYIKQRKKQYQALKDSVDSLDSLDHSIHADSLKQLAKSREEYYIYTDSLYSLKQIAGMDKSRLEADRQTISRAREELEGNEYLSRYRELRSQISGYRQTLRVYKDSLSSIDSLDREEKKYLVEQRKQELSREFQQKMDSITGDIVNRNSPELPGGFQNKELEKFQKAHQNLKVDGNGLVQLSKAQKVDHFAGRQHVLEEAQEKIAQLKKKYSEVPDPGDLSTATKASSLEGKRLKERLVFGGTFQLHVDKSTSLDLNPEIGYRLNRKFELGFGGTYRLRVATKDLPQSVKEPTIMGFRGFARHRLVKSFYVHGEYEGLRSSLTDDRQTVQDWHYSLLAGIQRRFRLRGKTEGQALILYNFNSRENPLYNSPWVFRVGFWVSGK
ncbi:hypothetical protein ACFSKL_02760 [Belliella marina]|uniref:Outer membrane protein beta-barrel domain-containing protein n=1 Tax=Belliella marina TaxID=1644146 RepID=A0ABW4VGC3_9BACT